MGRNTDPIVAATAALFCLVGGQAWAQEYCVSCSAPDALYRCVIENAQPGGGQSLQMFCITTMARQGGHATCAVKRGTVFQCDGAVKRIPWAALNAPQQVDPTQPPSKPAQRPETAAAPPPSPGPAPPPASPAPEAPPDTVLDLAKRANEDTAKQVRKAGETMKDATKKTWDCVASLFTRCW